ncbi:transmembrane protein 102 [Xenopus laevis]|uniref:Mab-21-like HhH/H2TH-like domain-containing protein n=2 Tax=Xenopus laevis TaxID=8355 RepID=A0A974DHM2_XENLA|nr:transmembrane protein 102 [Xenopus laevis]OCT90966.1 hypothetical protein XELAEV_18019585mg [Xenopus laevis]
MTSSARPLTNVDFCSGSRMEELNKLMEELERRESSALQGRDLRESCQQAMKYVFSLIEQLHPLPSPNSLLVLQGGLCSGSLDVSPVDLGSTSPLSCPPISYTILVPILRLPSPTLLHQTSPCHYRVPVSLWDPPHPQLSSSPPFVSPYNVSVWFTPSLLSAVSSCPIPAPPHLCQEGAEPWGNCTSLLFSNSSDVFLRFDVVPVVEVRGWPAGVQYLEDWVDEEQGPPRLFHLLPWGAEGQWRVSFPGVELFMRRCLHPALSRVLRASVSVLRPFLQGSDAPGPYVIWVTLLHACERLPKGFLCQGHNAASCFLGLLEELSFYFLRGSCPNPFLPGCDLLSGISRGPYLAHRVSEVRAQPVTHLREAVKEAKEANKGGERDEKEETEQREEERGSSCSPS